MMRNATTDNTVNVRKKIATPNVNQMETPGAAYADMRLKMGEKKSPFKQADEESIPSDLDMEDAWGEFPKYQYLLHQ